MSIVPIGCDEGGAASSIQDWLRNSFKPPQIFPSYRVLPVRIVPDGTSSCQRLLLRIVRAFSREIGVSIEIEAEAEPSENLGLLVELLHEQCCYPIIIIERFHSFARIADDKLIAFLSQLRSMEHNRTVTTISLSPIAYDVMRSRFPADLPFVNSVYGDNHDRVVMPPLSFVEFRSNAGRFSDNVEFLTELFRRGGGPDVVFQALLDEAGGGIDGIEDRVSGRIAGTLERFLSDAIEELHHSRKLLLGLIEGSLSAGETAYLLHIPQSAFLIRVQADGRCAVAGSIVANVITRYCSRITLAELDPMKAVGISKQEGVGRRVTDRPAGKVVKVLFLAANPRSCGNLELENELRSVNLEIEGSKHRDNIQLIFRHAVNPADLVRVLRTERPQIVHFSGHGSDEGLVFRNVAGDWSLVTASALARVFRDRGIRLVVLNACYSDQHATEILPSVGAVIGTTKEVGDEAAHRFSATFYRTFGDGFSVAESFRDGGDAIDLHDLEDVFALLGDGSMSIESI